MVMRIFYLELMTLKSMLGYLNLEILIKTSTMVVVQQCLMKDLLLMFADLMLLP